MNEDRVTGLNTRWKRVEVVGMRRARIVRGEESCECGFLLPAAKAGRIDMVGLAARSGFRLETSPNGDDIFRFSFDPVGIRQRKPAFVIGRGLQVEDAPGESVRRDVLKSVFIDAFVTEPTQRQDC